MNNHETLALGKCPACKSGVTVTKAEAIEASWQVRSACCRRWTVVKSVEAVVTARACGAHCTDATSTSCKCECGGASHGIAWRIK